MKIKVFRAWGQILYLAVCFGGFLLIAIAAFTVGDVWGKRDLVLYVSICLASVIALLRTFRLDVAVDEAGIEIRVTR